MRILSMTATFGKLENQTLTLKPGLNILHAPNEWGKSTWCAFLTVMLYGIDTGARSKKGVLADKERYAPWSGAPMSGRMEIDWEGQRITIERKVKGRTPMGDFSAYETDTGLPVSELNAGNCGEKLLGVERSVFQRAGFIQLSDLPVTQDESLRRRLNALVTTGDENSAGDDLAQKLKDLKNKCRFNRSGLLPQAEAQRDALSQNLAELHKFQAQAQSIRDRQAQLESHAAALENHKAHLSYQAAEADRLLLQQAEDACQAADRALSAAEESCASLPSREEAAQKLDQLQKLEAQQLQLQLEKAGLPSLPQAPVQADIPSAAQARADHEALQKLEENKRKKFKLLLLNGIIPLVLIAMVLLLGDNTPIMLLGALLALIDFVLLILLQQRRRQIYRQIRDLTQRYPGLSPDKWLPEAQKYEESYQRYRQDLESAQVRHEQWQARQEAFDKCLADYTQGRSTEEIRRHFLASLAAHDRLSQARQEKARAAQRAAELHAMARCAPLPEKPDSLSLSSAETESRIPAVAAELQQLHTQLGICRGKMEQLGDQAEILAQLDTVNARIRHLELTYKALEIAQKTLSDASTSLQRRFAPRISSQAQDIFSRLTGGRYSRLTLAEDLSIQAGAETETTLRPALWRSEGTIDQLYLALRLAVARELTPQAPLVLDDALARFDDTRLSAALDILKEEAKSRQVILFSCQSRETALV